MFNRIADWLIARAKKTPYFHLPKYMNRWWLMPYAPGSTDAEMKHGQYTANWRKEPFLWLLQQFGIGVRVHEILRSDYGVPLPNGEKYDDGRPAMFHDHPWPYITVILKRGYFEVTPVFVDGMYTGTRKRFYGPGSVLFRRAQSWHRLELPRHTPYGEEQVCTTLFITFKYKQRWGYLVQPEYKRYYRQVHAEAAAKLPEIR